MTLRSTLYLVLLLSVAILISACGGEAASEAPPANTPADAALAQDQAPDSSAEQAEQATESESEPADQAAAGDVAHGEELFQGTCTACHGPSGEGVEGLGSDLTTSEFVAGQSEAELVEFLKVGRDTSDPMNTSGVAMPPKGGNPALTEGDLQDIAAYVKTLNNP